MILLVPDIAETSTVKRAEGFLEMGQPVTVFGFRRGRYHRDYRPEWPCIVLGATADAHYLQRSWAVLRAFAVLLANGERLRAASALYARNLDQLVLALLARAVLRSRAAVAYEVLDVNPRLTRRGPTAVLLRALERWCLRRTSLLVVSSPAFLWSYFGPRQGFWGPWLLLENKLGPALRGAARPSDPNKLARERPRGARWVVGYVGLIRGKETLDLIVRLADRLRGLVVFKLWGVPTTVDRTALDAALAGRDNLIYAGEFVSPRDLAAIYGELDFAWAIDLENPTANSRWLLPCRFYEAGFHGVPCLAARGFQIGTLVERLGVGWAFEEPLESALARFFADLSRDDYARIWRRLTARPTECFVAGEDLASLSRRLGLVAPGRRRVRPTWTLPVPAPEAAFAQAQPAAFSVSAPSTTSSAPVT